MLKEQNAQCSDGCFVVLDGSEEVHWTLNIENSCKVLRRRVYAEDIVSARAEGRAKFDMH